MINYYHKIFKKRKLNLSFHKITVVIFHLVDELNVLIINSITVSRWNFIPFLENQTSQISFVLWLAFGNLSLHVSPNHLNRIEIRALRWMDYDFNVWIVEPFFNFMPFMTWGIILLKSSLAFSNHSIGSFYKVILEDLFVLNLVHSSLNLIQRDFTISWYGTPNHYWIIWVIFSNWNIFSVWNKDF